MRLTPSEQDRLLVFAAAELAQRHRAAGIALNAPEAVALICEAMFEAARAGATYEAVEQAGREAVKPVEVMDGVAQLVDEVRLEVLLGDGTRLIVVRHPLEPAMAPDSSDLHQAPESPARETTTLTVTNTGQRPIRVSSHFPFHEANRRLEFDRHQARGFRLDLPAGATLRWAPGETHEVTLVRLGRNG